MALIVTGLLIFLARIVDVSLGTLRILFLMRGRSLNAALVGFAESALYIIALSEVVKRLDEPINMVFFAAGFGAGNYVGSLIEERIAVGFVNVQVISLDCFASMEMRLRDEGFGVTTVEGCGRDGTHQILYVLVKRRDLPGLMRLIHEEDVKAFVTVMDARKIIGGYFTRKKSK
ncbi:MAG: DUF2179 domain-containing protein [Bacillota bacterium]